MALCVCLIPFLLSFILTEQSLLKPIHVPHLDPELAAANSISNNAMKKKVKASKARPQTTPPTKARHLSDKRQPAAP
jgi:hypothetical protein